MQFEDIKDYYNNVYRDKRTESFPFDKQRYQAWLSGVDNLQKDGERCSLDIGCGVGFICRHFFESGYLPYGIDISREALDMAKEIIPEGDFQLSQENGNLNFNDNFFNVVTCFGVLEHILDQELMLKETFRTLKENGRAVFVVPNKASPYFWMGGTEQIYENPRSYSGWKTLFEKAGFRIVSVKRDPGSTFAAHVKTGKRFKVLLNKIISSISIKMTYQFVFVLSKENTYGA